VFVLLLLFRSRKRKCIFFKKSKVRAQVFPSIFCGIHLHEIDPHSNSTTLEEALMLYSNNFHESADLTIDELKELLRRGAFRLFILKKDDLPEGKEVAGMALTVTYGQNIGVNVEYFAISPACQGKGLGTLFLNCLISSYKREVESLDRGPCLLTCECEEKLSRFYSRSGFQKSSLNPDIWENEKDGVITPVSYYLLGTSLRESGQRYLNDEKFLLRYQTKIHLGFDQFKSHRQSSLACHH